MCYEHPYHIGTQVFIRYLSSISFYQKPLYTRLISTFANKINFIVSKLTTRKSKLSDLILPHFEEAKSQRNFSQKNNFIVPQISFIVGEKFHYQKE